MPEPASERWSLVEIVRFEGARDLREYARYYAFNQEVRTP
jgi:hypothetical protein